MNKVIETRNRVMISENLKEFVGSDPRRSWQEIVEDKPREGRQGQHGKEL